MKLHKPNYFIYTDGVVVIGFMRLTNEQINHMFTNKYSTTKVILLFYFTKFGHFPKVLFCTCKSYISILTILFTLNTSYKWKNNFYQVFLYLDTPILEVCNQQQQGKNIRIPWAAEHSWGRPTSYFFTKRFFDTWENDW